MPELPDVQVHKEYVDATSLHQPISGVHFDAADLRETVDPSALERRLRGRSFRSTRRHGKHLFLRVDDVGWLRLHFGMTGDLAYFRDDAPPEHTKLLLDFRDDCHLAYISVRKFGEIGWVDDVDAFLREKGLGPDAMELEPEEFRDRISGRRGSIKGALMNQQVLAGLGNEYTDETLFRAGLHPGTPVAALDEADLARLYRAMREVIEKAVAARVDPERMPDSFLLPRREERAPCPRCGRPLEKTRVVGRPTYLCPHDQRKPGG